MKEFIVLLCLCWKTPLRNFRQGLVSVANTTDKDNKIVVHRQVILMLILRK